jgi:hypothetical protein
MLMARPDPDPGEQERGRVVLGHLSLQHELPGTEQQEGDTDHLHQIANRQEGHEIE